MKLRGRKAGNYRGDIPLCMSCVCVVGGGGPGGGTHYLVSVGARCEKKKPLVLVLCSARLLIHLVSATGRRVGVSIKALFL